MSKERGHRTQLHILNACKAAQQTTWNSVADAQSEQSFQNCGKNETTNGKTRKCFEKRKVTSKTETARIIKGSWRLRIIKWTSSLGCSPTFKQYRTAIWARSMLLNIGLKFPRIVSSLVFLRYTRRIQRHASLRKRKWQNVVREIYWVDLDGMGSTNSFRAADGCLPTLLRQLPVF